jgi:hypothetical protein
MAHTHIEHEAMVNPVMGIFPLYCKVDFKKHPFAAAADYLVLAKLLKNWIILDSYWKFPTDSTAENTVRIGTTYSGAGVEVVTAADCDAGSQTAWTQGTIKSGGIEIVDADSYLTMYSISTAMSDGIMEVLLLIAAGVDESHPADKVAVTS